MWFKNLMGFEEVSHENVQKNIVLDGENLTSIVNGKSYRHGTLELASLEDLRNRISLDEFSGKIQISEVVGNVMNFHRDADNADSVFQAASQFNLLEMVGPNVTPEEGIDIYENDKTQGPACAISCGAGTTYRNYLIPLNGKTGQTTNNQIDCLELIDKELGNQNRMWKMKNGYVIFTSEGLKQTNSKISSMSVQERENLKGKLQVGIQWNTEVTISDSGHHVTQVYCAAVPVSYHYNIDTEYWETFARVLLEAAYEATFYTAVQNFKQTGNDKLFLTLVGGGVYGNRNEWILDAIAMAMEKFRHVPLDVKIVTYGYSSPEIRNFVAQF